MMCVCMCVFDCVCPWQAFALGGLGITHPFGLVYACARLLSLVNGPHVVTAVTELRIPLALMDMVVSICAAADEETRSRDARGRYHPLVPVYAV
jgi:hypothetical protein